MIEDWLLKDQEFTAENSKDSFIRKSIVVFSKLLKNIRRENKKNSFIYKINSAFKLTGVIINLVMILLSRNFIFLIILNILFVFGLLNINKKDRMKIFLMSLIFPAFTFVILIPSVYSGNYINSFFIFYKVFLNILCINILITYSCTWQEVVNSFRIFLIPDIFIWIFELTVKYILLLGEYTVEVLQALKLRAVGRSAKIKKTIFPVMGNMFLTSVKMSEEMVDAMTCRGFTGEYKLKREQKLHKEDYFFIIIEMVIIAGFYLFK